MSWPAWPVRPAYGGRRLAALIDAHPECVVYCAMGDTRPVEATNDVRRLLEAGIHVIGSAPGTLQYPWGTMPPKVIDKVEAAARAGGATVYVTGVDPGFASDLLPLALASTCQRIEQVRCYELADYATYDGAEVMFDLMGFGRPMDEIPMLFLPGRARLRLGHGDPHDRGRTGHRGRRGGRAREVEPAPESYDIAAGRIEKGTIAAMRFSITGMVAGHPAIVVEHVTRTRDDLRPDWARPAGGGGAYRIEITGEPSYVVDIMPSSEHGDHNHSAIVAACGRIVNAIPDVLAADPGILTTLDLPLPTGRGTYVGPPGLRRVGRPGSGWTATHPWVVFTDVQSIVHPAPDVD